MVPLIEKGAIQGMILDQAYEYEKRLGACEVKVVGVNLY